MSRLSCLCRNLYCQLTRMRGIPRKNNVGQRHRQSRIVIPRSNLRPQSQLEAPPTLWELLCREFTCFSPARMATAVTRIRFQVPRDPDPSLFLFHKKKNIFFFFRSPFLILFFSKRFLIANLHTVIIEHHLCEEEVEVVVFCL